MPFGCPPNRSCPNDSRLPASASQMLRSNGERLGLLLQSFSLKCLFHYVISLLLAFCLKHQAYEEESYQRLCNKIEEQSILPKAVFTALLNKIFKRSK